MKEYKTIKSNIRTKIESVNKIQKRNFKDTFADRNDGLEDKMYELQIKCKLFENQEKQAVRRACLEERSLYSTLATFVKQIMWKQSDILRNVNTKVDNSLVEFISHDIPDISLSPDPDHDFDTPATSVGGSLRGSRCGSFSSLGSSRLNSPLCIVEQRDLSRGSVDQRRRKSQVSSHCPATGVHNEGIVYSNSSHPFYAQVGDNLALKIFHSDTAAYTGDQAGGLQSSELVNRQAGWKGGVHTCLLHHQTDTESVQETGPASSKTADTQEDAK